MENPQSIFISPQEENRKAQDKNLALTPNIQNNNTGQRSSGENRAYIMKANVISE